MTQTQLFETDSSVLSISPYLELGAYEELWSRSGATPKRIADNFRGRPEALPSDFVDHDKARQMAQRVLDLLQEASIGRFGLSIHGTWNYPEQLRDARHPPEILYYQGIWDLVETPKIAVVGTRKPSDQGLRRTRRLVKSLVNDGWTIVSGLADGIDSAAHRAAIEENGRTIAVLGTPLSKVYPRANEELQRQMAREQLILSEVPVYRYNNADWRSNRAFFPQRNHTMAALSQATVIVEAGPTSGTLIQARGALEQGRQLFILESCFQNPELDWPRKFENRGAIRVREYEDIVQALTPPH